ncbi:amidohydrolase 2 [Reticulomyxa filosa]|uniref:Amidohydrolase 2 n=1 Tax=Reticulomyxa filosa TaxID=46433 RepID=X6NJ61_RETFI|nr:amidohydrolase 2 [Reticulomyxa filosa]|eukprot:ETO26036.1 amidohydrolase 2 [Reticulomyxa filosa]
MGQQAHPDRFKGVVSVNLTDPCDAVQQIDYYVKKHNFKAVRVVPWIWDMPPTNRYYYPIFVKCVELDIPFCTQVGHTGPLCPSETGRPIPYIDRVALDFPQLKIIGGHIGYPWINEMISCAWKHANVYIDTSAYLPKYYPKELIDFMNTNGADRVMFGTNYPQLMLDACVQSALTHLKLKNKQVQSNFLYENAIRVFKLDSKTTNKSNKKSHDKAKL